MPDDTDNITGNGAVTQVARIVKSMAPPSAEALI